MGFEGKTKRINGSLDHHSDRIIQELLRSGEVAVDRLAVQLEVSASTIRRTLGLLEKQGLLRRTHGGAVPVGPNLYEPFRHISSFQEQELNRAVEKRRIGLAAAALIADGDVVGIGAGTTTTQVARSLRHRKDITIVTNAVNIAMELSHQADLKVILTGGSLSGAWFALVGPTAIANVGELFVDIMFVGVDGIDAEHGLTTNYPDQATIHRAMLKYARKKVVVADHLKIGKAATARICPTDAVDVFITSKGSSPAELKKLAASGIKINQV